MFLMNRIHTEIREYAVFLFHFNLHFPRDISQYFVIKEVILDHIMEHEHSLRTGHQKPGDSSKDNTRQTLNFRNIQSVHTEEYLSIRKKSQGRSRNRNLNILASRKRIYHSYNWSYSSVST